MSRYHDGLLWTSVGRSPTVTNAANGQSLRIPLVDDVIGNADPAVTTDPVYYQLAYSTCSYLLNYPDAPGADGRRLRPEIAAAMPGISSDGRTYTFRIRPGFRFSPPSGQKVTAETFRFTIERALSPKLAVGGRPNPLGQVLANIVGVPAFTSGRTSRIRGITVRGDTLTIRLTRAEGDFPALLALSFFCPVPIGTPAVPGGGGSAPIAMTGPYYVASTDGGQVVVERNPNYVGSRPRRFERIVYTTGITPAEAVSQVESGREDYVSGNTDPNGPLALGGALDRAYGLASRAGRNGRARYVPGPAPGLDAVLFNTRRPLFRDVRMRQAVAYALDRSALAQVFGEQPSDRLIPRAVSGLAGNVAFTDGPDLTAARRLAGHSRRSARLYFCGDPANMRVAEIIRSNLARIGIAVQIDQSLGCLKGPETAKLAAADMQLISHFDAIPDPAPFVDLPLGDAYTGPGYWSDARLKQQIVRVREERGAARIADYLRLETTLVRNAVPITVYGNAINPEFFSARIGCEVSQGALRAVDLGALCVRG